MENKIKNYDLLSKLLKKSEISQIKSQEEAMHLILEKKVVENIDQVDQSNLKLGDKISDNVARVAGSWKFIITFMIILVLWIIVNSIALFHAVDPYPYILLNLILSCVAALQAPIIMMSQNRQDAKDRIRSENDYKVNLKTELILEDLHQKMDALILNQIEQKRMLNDLEKKSKSA
ncbi:MAG: DUF1003 domain-containing protein [Candidatus Izemoplasmatales bacterium]|nr:DUF1003 domain-containing protein [Candidatus Izemoplasmatales bacterium]